MELSIGMAQPEHQPWTGVIAGNADDHAIDCAATFDLYPLTLAGQVPPIPALRHDALDVRHQSEPVLGFLDRICLGNELQARGVCREHALEDGTPIA